MRRQRQQQQQPLQRPTAPRRRRRRRIQKQVLAVTAATALGLALLPAAAAVARCCCGFLPPAAAAVVPVHRLLTQRGGGGSPSSPPPPPPPSPSPAAAGADAPLLLPVPAFTTAAEVLESEKGLAWAKLLIESFQRTVGRPLLPGLDGLDERAQAQALFEAPGRVIVSHQTQSDPVLCYGNRQALALWEMDLATLTSTPSRLTAEPVERVERQRLLDTVAAQGFIDDYQGVRVSSTGRRFMIKRCIVWEVLDVQGVRRGQAATFEDVEPL